MVQTGLKPHTDLLRGLYKCDNEMIRIAKADNGFLKGILFPAGIKERSWS
jgi:hypothetical protein